MNWKKVLVTATLIGIMVLPAVSCSNSAETTNAVTTTAPIETTVAPQATTPADGEKMVPPSDNGTMPAPPDGAGQRLAAPEIDWAAAAAKLGVTEEQLKAAVGDFEKGMPDLETAATTLGVTVEALQEALGFTGGPPQGGPPEVTQTTTE